MSNEALQKVCPKYTNSKLKNTNIVCPAVKPAKFAKIKVDAKIESEVNRMKIKSLDTLLIPVPNFGDKFWNITNKDKKIIVILGLH